MKTKTNIGISNVLLAALLKNKDEAIVSLEEEFSALVERLINFKFSASDDSKIHEAFCLHVFLVACYNRGLLNGNLKICKQESPDFVITSIDGAIKIGLEHTCATHAQYKIAKAQLSKRPVGSLLELSRYSPFKPLKNKNADIGIIKPGAKLKDKGWKGNEPELEWSEIIFQAIVSKIETLNKSHFQQNLENHLIIEDDSPVDFVKDDKTAFKILRDRYSSANYSKITEFHKIHIFSRCILLYDFFGEYLEIDMHKAQLGNYCQ